jgi:transcriptional regulator with XRE-family HTH domain
MLIRISKPRMILNAYMPTENLAEFVLRITKEKNLSGYDIERRSRRVITQSYFNRIKNGEMRNPSIRSLAGLAKGLDEPLERLINAALQRKAHEPDENSRLLYLFHELSSERQQDLINIATLYLEQEQAAKPPLQQLRVKVDSHGKMTETKKPKRKVG